MKNKIKKGSSFLKSIFGIIILIISANLENLGNKNERINIIISIILLTVGLILISGDKMNWNEYSDITKFIIILAIIISIIVSIIFIIYT